MASQRGIRIPPSPPSRKVAVRAWRSLSRDVGVPLHEAQVDEGLRVGRGVDQAKALVPGDLLVDIADIEAGLRVDVIGRSLDLRDGLLGRLGGVDMARNQCRDGV